MPHINVFGGEDRFWLGPEGGQYALYFAPGDPFDFEHWQTPEAIDWGGWEVSASGRNEVRLHKDMQLRNHAGFTFSARVERTVRVLEPAALNSALGALLPTDVSVVGYDRERAHNTGAAPGSRHWPLSIWTSHVQPIAADDDRSVQAGRRAFGKA